ncbi:MAG: hypothetical protein SCJ94_08925 [Bacillota bacterium]|nr:hypothetical protein [Bacillota bacterium]
MNNLEENLTNIVALEPCYTEDGGNATRIYTASGEIIIQPLTLRNTGWTCNPQYRLREKRRWLLRTNPKYC